MKQKNPNQYIMTIGLSPSLFVLLLSSVWPAQSDSSQDPQLRATVEPQLQAEKAVVCGQFVSKPERDKCESDLRETLLINETQKRYQEHKEKFCASRNSCSSPESLKQVTDQAQDQAIVLCELNCKSLLPPNMHQFITGCSTATLCAQPISTMAWLSSCRDGVDIANYKFAQDWAEYFFLDNSRVTSATESKSLDTHVTQSVVTLHQCLPRALSTKIYCALYNDFALKVATEIATGAALTKAVKGAYLLALPILRSERLAALMAQFGAKAGSKGLRWLQPDDVKALGEIRWVAHEGSDIAFLPTNGSSVRLLVRDPSTGKVLEISEDLVSRQALEDIYKATAIGYDDGGRAIVTGIHEQKEGLYLVIKGDEPSYKIPGYTEAREKLGIKKIGGNGKEEVWEAPHPSTLNKIYKTDIFITHPNRTIPDEEYWRYLANGKVPIPISSGHDLTQHAHGYARLAKENPLLWGEVKTTMRSLFRIHDNGNLPETVRAAAINEVKKMALQLEAHSDALALNRAISAPRMRELRQEFSDTLLKAREFWLNNRAQ